MKNLLLFVLLLSFNYGAKAQSGSTYNNMTFFFVDNSSGFEADALNNDMSEELRNTLNRILNRNDNYFFFYGCNGEDHKATTDLKGFLAGTTLKKYLNKDSKESDYKYDRKILRETMAEYPVKIKQNLEVNIYLSYYAIKRMLKSTEELPSVLFFTRELPIYINSKDLNYKINVFINKEAVTQFGEATITNFLNFCNDDLRMKSYQFQLTAL